MTNKPEKTTQAEVTDKVAAQNVRLLLERQKTGKPLTRAQMQQVENYFGSREPKQRTWAKSMQELAVMFGVSRVTIRTWIKRGAPAANASGFYPIEDWRDWVESHGSVEVSDDEEMMDKSRLMAKQVFLRNQMLEIQLKEMRGEVLHRDEVRQKLYQTFDTCRRLQLRIGPSLAGRLSGLPPAQIAKEITSAIRDTYVEIQRWADEQGESPSGDDASSGPDSLRTECEEA